LAAVVFINVANLVVVGAKQDGEEVRRDGIVTEECRGMGNRIKDNRPFLHYYDLDKKGYRYATNWEIL